jgi:uncharacterized protein YceK
MTMLKEYQIKLKEQCVMKRILLGLLLTCLLAGCGSVNLSDRRQIMKKESADGVDCRICKYTLSGGGSFTALYDLADVGDSIDTRLGHVVIIDYKTGKVK